MRFFEGSAAGAEARIGAVGADGSARGAVAGGLEYVGVYAFDALPSVGRRELEYLDDFLMGFDSSRSFG